EAMEVFWEKGFDGTSFADIEAKTGVKKASLFAAYGDKRGLFLKAMRLYQENGRASCGLALVDGSPREALRRWFMASTGAGTETCTKRGCMQVNTIVELAQRDPEIGEIVQEHTRLMVKSLAETIRRGQDGGEFRTDVSAEVLAKYLI